VIILLQLLMMAREQDVYDGSRREKMERKTKMELRDDRTERGDESVATKRHRFRHENKRSWPIGSFGSQ